LMASEAAATSASEDVAAALVQPVTSRAKSRQAAISLGLRMFTG
jgi:hypothetical protein